MRNIRLLLLTYYHKTKTPVKKRRLAPEHVPRIFGTTKNLAESTADRKQIPKIPYVIKSGQIRQGMYFNEIVPYRLSRYFNLKEAWAVRIDGIARS